MVALIWANSPLGDSYVELWETPLVVELGEVIHLDHLDLRAWSTTCRRQATPSNAISVTTADGFVHCWARRGSTGTLTAGVPGRLVGGFRPPTRERPAPLLALLLAHAVLAGLAPAVGRRIGRSVFLVCALAPAVTVAWAASQATGVLDGRPVEETVGWVPALGLTVALRLDAFALLMVALVSGIGVLIFVYARWYFGERDDLGGFAGVFTAFAGSMLGLVLADNLLLLYVFCELTSVTSYLLIGSEDHKAGARAAALQAMLITGAGGLAMLGGFVVIGEAAGTYSLSGVLADPPSGTAVNVALVLVLLGAFTKSAQVPFHSWLSGAMAAPTPVSAYLHSATMVKAGVYLVARFAPAFALAGPWRPLVLGVGLATMLLGGLRALRQHDLKLLLAYGTVSQLGFLVVLFGVGLPEATVAGAALLLAHGAFKATLFMVVGIVDHQARTRDLRRLDRLGLARRWRPTLAVAAVAAASMAGLPLLFGFVAKETAYEAFVHGGVAGSPLVLAGIVAGSVLTFAYSARFVWGAFGPAAASIGPDTDLVQDAPRPAVPFLGSAALLAAATVLLGVAPALASTPVDAAARALDPAVEPTTLALWHGLNLPLLLSGLTVATGVALFGRRVAVERFQLRWPNRLPTADGGYRGAVRGLNQVADRVTGVVQNGSLPIYAGVILLTFVALPGVALVSGTSLPDLLRAADSPVQVVVAGVVAAAGIAAALVHRRFVAVLFLGAVGYGMAGLFVIQGAPDLALTQLLIETLAVVIFVLVLRRLPEGLDRSPWRLVLGARLVVSGGVGAVVFVFALLAGAARTTEPISDELVARALPDGGGRNVVNVILVDFRGLDTVGEITVLVVAALGIAAVARSARRALTAGEDGDGDGDRAEGLLGGDHRHGSSPAAPPERDEVAP
ncbi:Na+/H+ antiporter subunit A [soil metagenome]